MAPKVLAVLTSVDKFPSGNDSLRLNGSAKLRKAGPCASLIQHLPEFAHPYHILAPHVEFTVASPVGGFAPQDPMSVEGSKGDQISADFLNTKYALWENTEKLQKFVGKAGEFNALFYVGGQGRPSPKSGLYRDPCSIWPQTPFPTKLSMSSMQRAKSCLPSAVCHGPAALAFVKLPDGTPFLAGARVTGFSNSEEDAVGTTAEMPFLLETGLNKASNGGYQKAPENWGEFVVVDRDGKLITGQNPASAAAVGDAILKAISPIHNYD
ncbi:putative chaperone protein HSP31 [Halenospora varia]|nr:putative chaperone protein HSP31 [Halenospora varia]